MTHYHSAMVTIGGAVVYGWMTRWTYDWLMDRQSRSYPFLWRHRGDRRNLARWTFMFAIPWPVTIVSELLFVWRWPMPPTLLAKRRQADLEAERESDRGVAGFTRPTVTWL